jgi:carbamoylphosphate synthase large subunit
MIGCQARNIEMAGDLKTVSRKLWLSGPPAPQGHHRQHRRVHGRDRHGTIIGPRSLGGTGNGVAYNRDDYEHFCKLATSPPRQSDLIGSC